MGANTIELCHKACNDNKNCIKFAFSSENLELNVCYLLSATSICAACTICADCKSELVGVNLVCANGLLIIDSSIQNDVDGCESKCLEKSLCTWF